MEITRRDFVKTTAIGAAGILAFRASLRRAYAFYNGPGMNLFSTTLRGVETIPVASPDGIRYWQSQKVYQSQPLSGWYQPAAHYTIRIEQFTDELYPGTTTALWGYHPNNVLVGSPTPKHLGGIIIGRKGNPVQITFRNNLPPNPILPVDTSIPGVNNFAFNRTAVHLHGGLVPWISDGGPHDWWDPNGNHGLSFLNNQVLNPGAAANEAEYYYPLNQSARFIWYHDHAWGITRLNAYAGVATGLIIRDSFEDYLKTQGLPAYIEEGGREIPLVFQDKVFVGDDIGIVDPTWVSQGLPTAKGSLWYPHIYEPARWELSPIHPSGFPPDPSAIPEMFGDTMLVNGTVYPTVAVDARRYRFRVLNACQARFLNLQLYVDDGSGSGITLDPATLNPTNAPGPDFLVIGTEGGFLPKPVLVPSGVPFNPASLFDGAGLSTYTANPAGSLITGLAERWDILIDFSGFAGKKLILYSDAPAPFPSGDPLNDYFPGINTASQPANVHPDAVGPNTRVLMRFDIGNTPVIDPLKFGNGTDLINLAASKGRVWNDPLFVDVNGSTTLPAGVPVRQLTLNETFDGYGRLIQLVGTNQEPIPGFGYGREYMASPTEVVGAGETEVWEIANLTGDVHPMHFHLVNVQIINREPFLDGSYNSGSFISSGSPVLPDPTELGWKETVKMYPNTVTRVIMKFDLPHVPFVVPLSPRTGGSEFVWHCHILDHEEHDMMRPLVVLDPLYIVRKTGIIPKSGGSKVFTVQNFVGPISVTPSVPPSPTTYSLNVDTLNGRFTVTVPKVNSITPPFTVTFIVTDASTRIASNKTDTATLTVQ
jgi:spore coat protein A, manganese oxidase